MRLHQRKTNSCVYHEMQARSRRWEARLLKHCCQTCADQFCTNFSLSLVRDLISTLTSGMPCCAFMLFRPPCFSRWLWSLSWTTPSGLSVNWFAWFSAVSTLIGALVHVCRVLKGARWSVWCECVVTYTGRLEVAKSFTRQWQQQYSSAKLLSWHSWCVVYLGYSVSLPWYTKVAYGVRYG